LLPGKTGPGRFQPYARYETIDVTAKSSTDFITVGSNYHLSGHDAKISVDYTVVDPKGSAGRQNIVTLQVAVGF
jgi:hypothetical protein